MKKIVACLIVVGWALAGRAQPVVTTNPAFPKADQPLTITVDVTGTSLDGYAWDSTHPVYIWAWYKKGGTGSDIDAPTNVNPATSGQAAAKCTQISTNPDKYQITITPTVFLNASASDLVSFGLKLKTTDWADNKQSDNDKFITFSSGYDAFFSQPTDKAFFADQNETIPITAIFSDPSNVTLNADGSPVTTGSTLTEFDYSLVASQASGTHLVECVAIKAAGGGSKTISFTYSIRTATVNASRPAGVIDGINYGADPTQVTLSLWAPGKSSVYILGDFNNWQIDANYQMKKDGEHFWLPVTGLTSGTEYAYTYLVDETLRIADPYSDKILDPDDATIPASSYPNLKAFPVGAQSDKWYFQRASVLQTGQTPYAWQTTAYQKPPANKLVIYELLIRDFFASTGRNYQNLIDTIQYFKRIGINAVELMPITEFNGNEGWGYNPTFMFAPDKYYGTKNKLKEFVDKCHAAGIAVIMDMVMNHQDVPNSYAMMDFDFTIFKPNPTNKWFNVDAPHPFSVFFDLNHESPYTRTYLDTINYYWIHEYKIDGYRYDLSKGFTQTYSGSDVGLWGNYDQSRVDNITRMAQKIRAHTPDAYIILEHFAANDEETVLAADSLMLWGNMNYNYTQNTEGYANSSDISWGYYKNRTWTKPGLVTYMESHDEERLMYNNLQYGVVGPSYSAKDLNSALKRMKAAFLFLLAVPGPKMMWEFGEVGYELSINTCTDGSVNNNCRLDPKPVHWEYKNSSNRKELLTQVSDLNRLRKTYDVFTEGDATFPVNSTLFKQISIKNVPYTDSPTDASQMNVVAIANFDVASGSSPVSFPHTGVWYDYYAHGTTLNVTSTSQSLSLGAGGYKLYTDVQIEYPVVTAISPEAKPEIALYPNPASEVVIVEIEGTPIVSVTMQTLQGNKMVPHRISENAWDIRDLSPGLYVTEVRTADRSFWVKLIKK